MMIKVMMYPEAFNMVLICLLKKDNAFNIFLASIFKDCLDTGLGSGSIDKGLCLSPKLS